MVEPQFPGDLMVELQFPDDLMVKPQFPDDMMVKPQFQGDLMVELQFPGDCVKVPSTAVGITDISWNQTCLFCAMSRAKHREHSWDDHRLVGGNGLGYHPLLASKFSII